MSWCTLLGHAFKWEPMTQTGGQYVQYGTCSRCGYLRAREIILRSGPA